jgi:hypothetical protein
VALAYGVQLIGTGTVWIDDINIDSVGYYEPANAEQAIPAFHPRPDPQKLAQAPQNLDFEE